MAKINDNDIIESPEHEMLKTDILGKLYQLFEIIGETVIHNHIQKICSYKIIRDDTNVFIMINRETLQRILENEIIKNDIPDKLSVI
jgi:hypothetical protein